MDDLFKWLAGFFGHAPTEGVDAMVISGIQAGIVLLGAFVVSRALQKVIAVRFKSKEHKSDQVIRTYRKVVRWLVWGVGLLTTLHVLGLDLTPVFTTSGLFAVALGFALKDIAGNYFAGLVIKANDFVKHGDVLDIKGQMVRVKSIGVRDTLVRTKDGLDILIPNSALVQNDIGNYTLQDSLCRVWTTVGVSYSSDLQQVRQVLEETLNGIKGRSEKYPPNIYLNEFGNSAVIYRMSIIIDNPWDRRKIRSKVNEAIWRAFNDAGIVIAFPQLDVHLDKGLGAGNPDA
jgi:small-conductance mechanosensitive channel